MFRRLCIAFNLTELCFVKSWIFQKISFICILPKTCTNCTLDAFTFLTNYTRTDLVKHQSQVGVHIFNYFFSQYILIFTIILVFPYFFSQYKSWISVGSMELSTYLRPYKLTWAKALVSLYGLKYTDLKIRNMYT